MSQASELASDFCPSCGNFVNHIDAITGWCYVCSGDTKTQCIACGREFTKDQPHRKLCGWCREERWLIRHADEIEEYMQYGASFQFAKRETYYNSRYRPVCISCGRSIKFRPANGAIFCKQTIRCRRWRRRYRTLREQNLRKGIIDPAKMAHSQVAAEIFAETYVMTIEGG